jgi:hypothetical protein
MVPPIEGFHEAGRFLTAAEFRPHSSAIFPFLNAPGLSAQTNISCAPYVRCEPVVLTRFHPQ